MSHSPEYTRRYRQFGPIRSRGDGVVDEIAVERALRGTYDPRRLTHEEVTAAVRVGMRWGLSDPEIGRRLDLTTGAVFKRRLRAGLSSARAEMWVSA